MPYKCLASGKPCLYKAEENPELGWTKFEYENLEDAQRYMAKYLGEFWDYKDTSLFPYPFEYNLYGVVYTIIFEAL